MVRTGSTSPAGCRGMASWGRVSLQKNSAAGTGKTATGGCSAHQTSNHQRCYWFVWPFRRISQSSQHLDGSGSPRPPGVSLLLWLQLWREMTHLGRRQSCNSQDKQGGRGRQQREQICQQVFLSNKLRLRYRHSAKGGRTHALQYEHLEETPPSSRAHSLVSRW